MGRFAGEFLSCVRVLTEERRLLRPPCYQARKV